MNYSKNLCLVKFEVLGYQNKKEWLNIMSMSDPQINLNRFGCVKKKKKNDRNEINSEGSPHLTMHSRKHLPITSGFSFLYCCSRSPTIFQCFKNTSMIYTHRVGLAQSLACPPLAR